MSDTIFTDINPDTWTQVSVGDIGYVTNAGDQDIIYVEAASTPATSLEIGHTLHPKEARTYNLLTGQEMYARTFQTTFPVAVTAGLGFGELGPLLSNLEEEILPSAARTASVITDDITNISAKGAHFVIDISDIDVATQLFVNIQGKDSTSGNYYDILITTALNIVDTFILKVYPGLIDVQNAVSSDILPLTYRFVITNTDTDSITYSITALYVT